ncbi:MAG: hypothetical protein WA754_26160 [Pseudolabrys sp.]
MKYKHHFGLESFSNPAEHWILQASLTHSMSDALFALSFVSAFNALALAVQGSRGIGFVGDLFGSVGTASCIGFSFSKFPLSTHPTRPRARSAANAISFLLPVMQGSGARILPHRARNAGGKINGLKRKVADVLISIAA